MFLKEKNNLNTNTFSLKKTIKIISSKFSHESMLSYRLGSAKQI